MESPMPFLGFECQRCGECCRKLGPTTLSFSEEDLREFERIGVGSNLGSFRVDNRIGRHGSGADSVYEVLLKKEMLWDAGAEITLETEGEHCAFLTLDDNEVPACGMQLDYGIKPNTCVEFPLDPKHGVTFSNCTGCRLVLGEERSDELLRKAMRKRSRRDAESEIR